MSVSDERARARERVERQQALDTPSFGGRRIGLVSDEERARRLAMERHLLVLARRVVRRES